MLAGPRRSFLSLAQLDYRTKVTATFHDAQKRTCMGKDELPWEIITPHPKYPRVHPLPRRWGPHTLRVMFLDILGRGLYKFPASLLRSSASLVA